ncbi:MAG: translation initiation factor IF-2 N-terminal domain-containing protein [Bacteroidales bacterium]|nr:translation initiation factor IF-2 N-terminal domain-containing protein [Bacteroidales bacterium]
MKQNVFKEWQNGNKSVMMQMPTGTGKTMLFASIIKDLWDNSYDKRNMKRFLVLVHRKELVEQVQKTLYDKYGLAHGTIQSGKRDNEMYHIQVAMVQTLAREKRLNKWKDNEFDFIICDEAHHILADSYQKIRKAFPEAYLLGVTATPYRLNKQPFTDTFDVLVRSKPISWFIKDGYLSEYEYYSIEATSKLQLEIDNLKIDSTGDYSDKAMTNALDNRKIRAKVVKTWLEHANGKKTIVYTINKEHNQNLCQEFIKIGYKCVAIDSDTPKEERDNYVNQFRKGEITIICNVNIFSEGFDCPDVECIQLARPTTSLSMYLQQVGRGLRISKNKEKTIFLDNIGLYNRFGLPSANRQWQYHFEGKEDYDDKRGYELTAEEIYRPKFFDIEEADDDFELQYSNVEEKDDLSIVNVAKKLNIEVDSIIQFFLEQGIELNPNSELTDEQLEMLKEFKMKKGSEETDDGFISIFDIPNEEAEGKKNFYCKIRNFDIYEEDEFAWEIVFYKKFVDCYVDIVNRLLFNADITYIERMTNKSPSDNTSSLEDMFLARIDYDISRVLSPKDMWELQISKNRESVRRPKILQDYIHYIEVNLNNKDKLERLKYLLTKVCEFYQYRAGVSYEEVIKDLNIYFNFNTPNIETNELNNEEKIEENVDIIKTSDMEYNIDKMQEKEIIELMLMLHDKINVEILDEEKAEKRLEEIEKESEKRQVYKKFEESVLSKEDILKLAAMMQEEENKKLEEIAKHNIETQSYLEEARRKSALNNLKSKFDEHNA